MADVIQFPPPTPQSIKLPETKKVTHEELQALLNEYMEVLHKVDKRVARNVNKMYALLTILPLLAGAITAISQVAVRYLMDGHW